MDDTNTIDVPLILQEIHDQRGDSKVLSAGLGMLVNTELGKEELNTTRVMDNCDCL